LYQGDPAQETVYFEHPLEAAQHWVSLGARMVHLVDLDATIGTGGNRDLLLEIARTLPVPVELAGGVRSVDAARTLLEGGAHRVVVGTVAVTKPETLRMMLHHFGAEHVVVSVDAKHGAVAVKGWQETSAMQSVDLAARVWDAGVRTLIYTDITRDGTLEGLNAAPLEAIRTVWRGELLAGGGVRDARDLELLERLGIEGAIVGRALYEGTLKYGDW
jgi:phosphoribosylformimino-5-aminoimidazole carboxamide ribotide isomerase